MDKREYLRSLGFTVGERGRFTPEMLSALEHYEEPELPLKIAFVECFPDNITNQVNQERALREPRTLYGYTREGKALGFVLCFSCKSHMMYCTCEGGIVAPPQIIATKEKEVRVYI